jgi:O-methyltransferase involved in polyketide biosynthesis
MKVVTSLFALVAAAVYWYQQSLQDGDGAHIGPTAHYTGHVWGRHGLSDAPGLQTRTGLLLFALLEPLMTLSRARGGPTVEEFLLARHKMIDHHLERLVDSGKVTQIIELAVGLSPRGLRFRKKYGDKISYIEADLPEMIQLKRTLLGPNLLEGDNHRLLPVNALLTSGPMSLKTLVDKMDKSGGTVIITEGLLNYFDEPTVKKIWKIISDNLSRFSYGAYISDIHLDRESDSGLLATAFRRALGALVRRPVRLLFPDRLAAEWALIDAGFLSAIVHRPQDWADEVSSCDSPGARLVHLITASVSSAI